MKTDKLEKIINTTFEKKEKVNSKSDKKVINAINETIDLVSHSISHNKEKQNAFIKRSV